jgi:hypothetical protein
MAPIEQSTSKSALKVKAAPTVEEDDKWTDLAIEKDEKDMKDEPTQTEATKSKPQANNPPLNYLPMGQGPPSPMAPIMPVQMQSAYPQGYDAFGRPLPSQQSLLENQLNHIAEVTLGVLNAALILESHLSTPPIGSTESKTVEMPLFPSTTIDGTNCITYGSHQNRYTTRSGFYQSERSNHAQMVRDMAHLLGLRRAVKILQDAADDETRENVKYAMKVITPTPPPPPPQPQMPPMCYLPTPPPTAEKELKTIAKDLVKDTIREYKDTVVMPGMEDVQKEMIKLCRDVCRDALNKNGNN